MTDDPLVNMFIAGARPVDRVLRGYELLDALGKGGFAEVWEAFDPAGISVAVKLFFEHTSLPLVRHEVETLARLEHPGVPLLLEQCLSHRPPFYVMERIIGEPLSAVGRPLRGLLKCFVELLDVLSYVHARGIVHHDLKPDNVLVTPAGGVKLLDFGIATFDAVLGATLPGGPCRGGGTPAYVAPEQVLTDTLGPATDLYTVGIMLFEALCGAVPLCPPNITAPMHVWAMNRLVTTPPSLKPRTEYEAVLTQAPFGRQYLDRLVREMLDPLPNRRPYCAADCNAALAKAIAALPSEDGGSARPAWPG